MLLKRFLNLMLKMLSDFRGEVGKHDKGFKISEGGDEKMVIMYSSK